MRIMGFNENTLISIRREDQMSYYNLKTLKSLQVNGLSVVATDHSQLKEKFSPTIRYGCEQNRPQQGVIIWGYRKMLQLRPHVKMWP